MSGTSSATPPGGCYYIGNFFLWNFFWNLNFSLVCPLINCAVAKSLRKFAHSTAVLLSCSGQNFQMIWQQKWMLWTNDISQVLSLKRVTRGYFIWPHPLVTMGIFIGPWCSWFPLIWPQPPMIYILYSNQLPEHINADLYPEETFNSYINAWQLSKFSWFLQLPIGRRVNFSIQNTLYFITYLKFIVFSITIIPRDTSAMASQSIVCLRTCSGQ